MGNPETYPEPTREESLYKALVEASPDAIMFSGMDGTIRFANAKAIAMGRNAGPQDLIGENLFRFIVKPDKDTMKTEFEKLVRGMNRGTLEAVLIRQDGTIYDAEITGAILWDEVNHMPLGLISVTRDISDRKELNRNLELARLEAEKANHLKDAFISNLSHEIRTPLNSILGFTDLIREETERLLTEKSKKYFRIIDRSADQLLQNIESMLDLSRLQTGTFYARRSLIDAEKIVQEVIDRYRSSADEKNIRLDFINKAGPVIVSMDSFCLIKPLSTLIGNAIKYTDRGTVTVTTSRVPGGPLVIVVKDTGIGMTHQYLSRLYQPFAQEETGPTRKFRGIGLSLSISKRLLAEIGASIDVESVPGKGTCFTISIPIN